jgi:nicotinic acid mononucleotide adenylyltransferase
MNKFQKWEAIEYLLKTMTILGVNYEELINEEIMLWVKSFNRSFIKPSREQVIIIRKLYMIQSYNISTSNKRELESVLETISSL